MISTSSEQLSLVFEEVVATHALHVAPSYLGDLLAGAKHHLNHSLFKYSRKLQGIPLCYNRVELLSRMPSTSVSNPSLDTEIPSAAIVYDNPCVQVPVKVSWTLFSPKRGSRISGKVNQIGRDHLGLLVFNYFTAVIYSNQLEAVLIWKEDMQTWSSRENGQLIEDGQALTFEVIDLVHEGPVFTLLGSLDKLLKEQPVGSDPLSIKGSKLASKATNKSRKLTR